jgi:hypothetical protein
MTKEHEQSERLTQDVVYPAHEDRTESSEFRKNKRLLVKQLDVPCWICGSRENREVHHLFEWSLFPALDTEKMLDTLHVFDPYGYTHKMGEQPIESPDDIRNLVVLCGVNLGVHEITLPIWLSLRAVKPGIEITKAVSHAQNEDKKLRGTKQS